MTHSRPLRANRQPYKSILVLLLWAEGLEKSYGAPLWLTYKQALTWAARYATASTAPWWSMPC